LTRAKNTVVSENTDPEIWSAPPPIPVADNQLDMWDTEAAEAEWSFDEPDLERDSAALMGVPLTVYKVVYRPKRNEKFERDWVSIEMQIASKPVVEQAIRRGKIPNVESLEGLNVLPGSKVVVNDGSTGVRRQLTEVFHNKGIINVGGDPSMGKRRFDREHVDWEECTQNELFTDEDGQVKTVPTIVKWLSGKPLRIPVRHGFRASFSPDYPETPIYYLH